jgi:RHH-type proline utilization regulon transcriptional repressor/proline dehydrogenase/delta 1-pyrroline-5-carboxylate dehydrogenase
MTGRHVTEAAPADVETALAAARPGTRRWPSAPPCCAAPPISTRRFRRALRAAGARGGQDAARRVAELREAVDFLRYYAGEAGRWPTRRGAASSPASARGTSRWRSSPARSPRRWRRATPCSPSPPRRRPPSPPGARGGCCTRPACREAALQLLPGGERGRAALTSDPRVGGVAFTGSTATAQRIHRAMAEHLRPRRAADRRDRRAQRHDRRQHRAARTGGARHRRLGLPVGRPALLGAAMPLCAGGHRRPFPRC